MFNDDSEPYRPIRLVRRNRQVRQVAHKTGLSKPVTLGSLLAIMIVLLGSITAMQLWTMQMANDAQIASATRPQDYTFYEARKARDLHDMVHDRELRNIRQEISIGMVALEKRLSLAIDLFKDSMPPFKSDIADMKISFSDIDTITANR